MIRSLAAVCLLTALAGPALASFDCPTIDEAKQDAVDLARNRQYIFTFLDDERARSFLTQMESESPLKFDPDVRHLVIFGKADDPRSIILLADGKCGGWKTFLTTSMSNVSGLLRDMKR